MRPVRQSVDNYLIVRPTFEEHWGPAGLGARQRRHFVQHWADDLPDVPASYRVRGSHPATSDRCGNMALCGTADYLKCQYCRGMDLSTAARSKRHMPRHRLWRLIARPDLFLNIQPTSNEMQRQSAHGWGPQA
jgi:hypothetical protein